MSAGAAQYHLGLDTSGMAKGFAAAGAMLRGFSSSFTGALGNIANVGGLLGGLGGIATGITAFKNALTGAADMESLVTSFETLTKSAEKGKALLGELAQFAKSTPLEMPEIANAAKSLLAFKSEVGQVVPELRMLGDVGALIGAPLGELAELFGKARIQGRLMAQDVNQLTGRGIPVIQEFAAQFGVGEEAVRGLVEAGKIGFPNLHAAFVSMTSAGGMYFQGLQKQSQTAHGLWSTLKDDISAVLREFGKPVLMELKGAMRDASELMGGLLDDARGWGEAMASAFAVVRQMFASGTLGMAFEAGLKVAVLEVGNLMISVVKTAAAAFGGALWDSVVNVGDRLGEGIGNMINGGAGSSRTGNPQGADFFNVAGARAQLAGLWADAAAQMQAAQKPGGVLAPMLNFPAPVLAKAAAGMASGMAAGNASMRATATDRLAKIGGYIGGGATRERVQRDALREAAETNRILRRIEGRQPEEGGTFR